MARYAPALAQLITQLGKLPSVGNKTAQRLAFHLMSIPESEALALAEAITEARKTIHLCPICCQLTDQDPCAICADPHRDPHVICVVENPSDVAAIEKSRAFHGRYHVLHGVISPMHKTGPDDIHLKELMTRLIEHPEIEEVFLANSSTTEGESTALYIARILQSAKIKTTRLAHGLPMGSSLELADEVTLGRAIEGRRLIE